MKILIDELNNNCIAYIEEIIEETEKGYHILPADRFVDREYTIESLEGEIEVVSRYKLYTVSDIPDNVEPFKYSYDPLKGFYKNTEYIYNYPLEEQIASMQDMINELMLGKEG